MFYEDDVRLLVNIFAEFLSIVESDNLTEEQYTITPDFEVIDEKYGSLLDSLFMLEPNDFLYRLSGLVTEIKKLPIYERPCAAYVCSLWLDQHLSYQSEEDKVSLYPICPINQAKPVVVYSLNSNCEETGIWINPKLKIHQTVDEITGEPRSSMVNRSAFMGINSDLHNVSYTKWDGKRIKNVIVPESALKDKEGRFLKIAFAPMTSERNLIDKENVEIVYKGRPASAVNLKLNKDFSFFSKRLVADWTWAARKGADIIFMPEMLGTLESCGRDKAQIDWVHEAARLLDEEEVDLPAITVLPSCWDDHSNSVTIVSGRGNVLGIQEKHVPYKNRDNRIEALRENVEKEITIIHIPNVHRMAVLICSEYLMDNTDNWSDLLCRSLGITLILVPSFSPGEQAFYKSLSRYREYGVSVVWGNCCGAVREDNMGIGGCCIAELNIEEFFGDICRCSHSCKNVDSCIFMQSIARKLTLAKLLRHDDEHQLVHILNGQER